ncbi:MAG: hypothetical protein D6798_05745 [Deltaproteobacteria bacterium]|nr:MAG: hypothetical protein D6798_05745 [Deltaproteobacteria bacterium]
MSPVLVALWIACGDADRGPPDRFEDCPDLDCRRQWVIDHWRSDQQAVIDHVVSTEDEVEQVALVMALADAELGRAQALCSALPHGPARVKCNQLNSRLHLVEDQPLLPPDLQRSAPGPVSWRLDVNDLPASPLADATLDADPCADAEDARNCRVRAALQQVRRGDVRRAAALCRAVGDPKWSAECAFQASEARVRATRGAPRGLRDAVDLCLLTGRFADNCLAHIPLRVGEGVPPVDMAEPEDWRTLVEQEAALHAALVERGAPALADAVRGLFWAETMGSSYTRAQTITGDPLDVLPPEAVPHIHAAAAVAMARTPPPEGTPSLARLAQDLAAMLRRRGPTRPKGAPVSGPWRPRADLWPIDRPGEGEIPAVVFLGASRRAWAADDELADLRICVLEAWARLNPHEQGLLAEGLADDHPLVRFTAARLERMRAEFPKGPAERRPPGQRGAPAGPRPGPPSGPPPGMAPGSQAGAPGTPPSP